MQRTGRRPDPSWPRRAGRSITKHIMSTLLAVVRPALGQVLLAGGAALSGGLVGLVPDATARWVLIGVTVTLLLTLAVSFPIRRRRARRARLRDGGREAAAMFSSSLARLVADGHDPLDEAFEVEALGLAAMRLAASLQPDRGEGGVGAELGLVAHSGDGAVRFVAVSGGAVGRPLRELGVVEESFAERLIEMAGASAWGAGHARTALVASGAETLSLYLVSSAPIAPEHADALGAMADTLRPVLAVVRRAREEAGHELR